MTKKEKINQIFDLEVKHSRMKETLESIEACHRSFFRNGKKLNLFISGETGLGKTTMCESYLSGFPASNDKKGKTIPVLYTSMPSNPTPKGLTTEMLDAMTCPSAFMGSLLKQKIRLKEFVRDCGVQMVILDELQHLIDPNSETILKAVSNLLKELINILKVPIVMVGLPESLAVLTSNRQLGRRVSQYEKLTEFSWKDAAQRREFRSILNTIDGRLPLNKSSRLSSPDMAKRIHFASEGVINHFMDLICYSAEFAVEKNMDCIDMDVLSKVYDKHISSLFPKKFNPFDEKNKDRQLTISPKKDSTTEPKSVSNRIKPRRKKETPGSVLRTR